MKGISVLCLALCLCSGLAFAQDAKLEPLMAPGDLAVTAGIGYGFFWGAIDVSGGVELMLGQFMLGDTLPLSYGVAAKAVYYSYSWDSWGYKYKDVYLGAGAFGTLHLGLRDVGLPEGLGFLSNTDVYIGLGAGFYSYTYTWNYDDTKSTSFKIGLRSVGGVNYFFTPKLAINFEGGYYGYGSGGGLIGLLFKL